MPLTPWKKSITVGTVGALVGGFLQWSLTERRLSIHIATADDRVAMMCVLAEYQAGATEKMCEAVGTKCPRPPDLKTEILARRCK